MSKIEVDAIEPQSGTSLTLGASGDTLTIPSGATLVNNGTASGFGDNLEWQSSIVTAATITVTANKGYWIDTTSNTCTITLPAAAAVGDRLIFTDYARNWATNAVTINPNSLNFQGNTTPQPVYDTAGESVDIVYSGATKGWIPNNDGAVVLETPQYTAYDIDYLVVAGGGSGGHTIGGGAGAGGMLNGTLSSVASGTLTATVGSGGAGISSAGQGNNGNNSVLSGASITTLTSIGGGGGGRDGVSAPNGTGAGADGGSGGGGGGAAGAKAGGSGTAGQGNDGGSANTAAPNYGSGGGGGKGAVGGNGSSSAGGAGGTGTANSITGSSVTYAGGGGGNAYTSGGGAGGSGGGGAGTGVNGTANTGGGGGGANSGTSGAGGSGVVILSMATANYTGTTTGSPTVSTSGANTILKFTGNGTYVTE